MNTAAFLICYMSSSFPTIIGTVGLGLNRTDTWTARCRTSVTVTRRIYRGGVVTTICQGKRSGQGG
ncbi:hypothetical protein BO82DRAFT_356758 [Aspergillus uvarum CBS 121591]|uniref:Uncharacterized protein n=1 Tax=Aspergillus uvarum CBS 121591 TaxID=1448315 RepID=A0A319C4T7_9EURO|nr:hypothetical protein BO82DRAFT_356758 [Aspergillus uvarum CBS 121591]PYH79161.1 hypothetical protein BO82DRAFT_356758 [Aspergillus uvarum CBS 121591]